MYMDVKIELNDELTLLINNVKYSPGKAGYFSGPPEKCYEDEPPEIDWKDDAVFIIQRKDKKELAFNIDTHFADLYSEAIFEYCDIEYRERLTNYD